MFRVIGGAVVYGLALYGVVKLFDRPKRSAAASVSEGQNDKRSVSQASEAPTPSGSTRSV